MKNPWSNSVEFVILLKIYILYRVYKIKNTPLCKASAQK